MPVTPILTDALIARIMLEQRQELRPPSGWGYAAWPLRAEASLATLTPEGWCHVGWIERGNHRRVNHPLRYQVWWQIDTGEVRRDHQTGSPHPDDVHAGNVANRASGDGR